MTIIEIRYLGSKVDTVNNGFFNALGKEALRNEFVVKVQNEIKELEDIEKVIEIIKTIEDENNVITQNTIFVVSISEKSYYLSNKFELISQENFRILDFTPYIKFDKSNCDITKEEQRVNRILKYKSSEEAISFVESYIVNLPKSFKVISDKPYYVSLYCLSFDKKFKIS
ncbi:MULTISPECIES: hypothetical protein [Arcobacter]|uniref:Uncharacterized protein n=2 Tax=Arcobacter TaxID=28196 RepID=A0A6M8NI95_9BACT|nr:MULTISPECIES: hypothetical protein [Arcobacter]QKF77980.1 hypothetical protein ADFLV_1964 [Arcobacter defluvii]QKF90129.1 hypothetical protein ACLO_1638 [Arcobacter cloacae]RXI32755.1 hypothetical protein CP964_07790 [Arcobacter defluvii]RXI38209.1 hypothetical protein CP963_11645 [Arcobacter cloacae]